METQRTHKTKMLFECSSCDTNGIIEGYTSADDAFLEFLTQYDKGKLLTGRSLQSQLVKEGMIQDQERIRKMLGNEKGISGILKSILFSKKDYVCKFETIKDPDPEMGGQIEDILAEDSLVSQIKKKGITQLYKFQEDAISKILQGKDIVITAPTASGKTEAFLLPVLYKIIQKRVQGKVFALFVYPTKALSKDQLPKIQEFCSTLGIKASVFDGDTNQKDRKSILEDPPQIIVTNFDVLHYHMMYRTKLASIIKTARVLVVDEVHVYSGIFGSNVHHIIKRLSRLCPRLQMVASSATLDNAKRFCQELFSREVEVVSGRGKRGTIRFAMLFPSLRSQMNLMTDLVKKLTKNKHKCLAFNNSHINSELLAMKAKGQGVNIRVHRAGLMPNYRKSVEESFKKGSIMAISTTPTLELGIDIGDVDVVITSIIPVNRLTQRMGRAARKGQEGYAFLILGNDPISQYYKNHPDDYFDDEERIYIDPNNPFVEDFQLLATACDRPISKFELKDCKTIIDKHLRENNLLYSKGMIAPNYKKIGPLLEDYSIRGIGKSIDIRYNGKKVGERNLPIALEELHPDAVYFLAGSRYKVKRLHYPDSMYAEIERIPRDYPYYTKALTEECPTVETTYETKKVMGIEVAFCKLHIEKRVYGYVNLELGQELSQGKRVLLESPLEFDFVTKGFVFKAPQPFEQMNKSGVNAEYVEASGYHATEHVVIEGSNMITGGASQDLGGISLGSSGLIYVHDSAIGGNGASQALFDRLDKAFERSLKIITECPCKNEAGCPRCTYSYRCGNNNEFLHKLSSTEILQRISQYEETLVSSPAENDVALV